MSGKTKAELLVEIESLRHQLEVKDDYISTLEYLLESEARDSKAIRSAFDSNIENQVSLSDANIEEQVSLHDKLTELANELRDRELGIRDYNREAIEKSDYLKQRYEIYLEEGYSKQEARKEANIDVKQKYKCEGFQQRALYKHLK